MIVLPDKSGISVVVHFLDSIIINKLVFAKPNVCDWFSWYNNSVEVQLFIKTGI
jgi:hypothetical protein